MNSIIFLGTAGDVEVMARQQRATGGIILNLESNQFHLDPGPGALAGAKAAKVNLRATIAVLASNNSILRSNDINACVSAMTLDGMDKHGVLLGSKSVVEGEEAVIRRQTKLAVEGLVSLTPGQKIGINEVTIWPVKSVGKDPNGVGFRIGAGDLLIGYAGDTSWYETMPQDYAGCAVLILNVKHPAGTREDGFLNVADAEALIKAVKPKHALLTGFGSKLAMMDLQDIARQIQRAVKAEVTAVKDGQKLELPAK